MKSHLNISTPSHLYFFFFLLLLTHLPSFSSTFNTTNLYTTCSNKFNCGAITGVDYPFWGGDRPKQCGHPDLHLNCNNNTLLTTITIFKIDYRVLHVDQLNQILTIKRNDLAIGDICPAELINTTIESSLFEYASSYVNITIQYGCPSLNIPIQIPVPVPQELTCTINGSVYQNNYILPGSQGPGLCRASIVIPVQTVSFTGIGDFSDIGKLIEGGFEVKWKLKRRECDKCMSAGGRCGFDLESNQFVCVCPESDRPSERYGNCGGGNLLVNTEPNPQPLQSYHHPSPASVGKGGSKVASTSIVLSIVGAVVAGIGFGWLVFYCRQRRKRLGGGSSQSSITHKKELPTTPLTNKEETFMSPSVVFAKSVPSYPSTVSEFGKDTSYFGARVFSCNELEEATENFAESRELGDGGFGAVYYGKLADGRVVAVKRLYENNYKRVEQFMNEVEILTRLRHANLVTLYGCTSKKSKELLLVYEYVPNGTVAEHLHGKRVNSRLLSWPVRLNIAIETANALAYLHASDIIHRDVKTTNILLDNDFHVKVADFGLVRLFPNHATHVSTAPQGTPGYVDPDYYQSYQLTEKSDVYSFGVVLIELISSLQAVDTNRNRHEINLSTMAINKIQNHTLHELVDPNLQFEGNTCVKRMITLVAELAFRCLQQEKDLRPSMQEVLDTLLGIKKGVLDSEKVQVLSIIVDDGHLVKDNSSPFSPDSVTNKWDSGSTKNSSG